MKARSIAKLMDLPLGYFNMTGSGKICRTLNETIIKTESYLAHQMPDMIGAFVTPIAIFAYTQDTKAFLLDFLFYLFFTPIYGLMMMKIMWVSQNTQLASDAVDRMEDLLNERTLTYKTIIKKPENFDITFESATFAYPNSMKNAVENINIEIKYGQTVGLVGGSGV